MNEENMQQKLLSSGSAIDLINNGDTVAFSGFVGNGAPDELISALETRFLKTGTPANLTLMFGAAAGDGKELGLNKLAHEGLVSRMIGGHYGLVPKLGKLAIDGSVEAYNLPLGCVSHLFRDIAAGRPGTISKIGLHTFVDPRHSGGKINDNTTEDIVKLIEIEGKEWLLYKPHPIDVALIRGTTADPKGNISMEKEALTLDTRAIAMAAKNSGGIVIAQVESITEANMLNPRQVQIPGIMVDCVVVASAENHKQTYITPYSRAYASDIRIPINTAKPMDLDARKVIARRAALELPMNGVVNLGIGMPEGVAAVANEEGVLDFVTLTAEPGVIGGVPSGGLDFGTAINTDAIIQMGEQFDFYDGGGLDLACLGMAQCDETGNVNVSRFGPKLAGAGGFINISQNAQELILAGTFTTGGLKTKIRDGKLYILQEGANRKFVKKVEEITFNGAYSVECGQVVLYVTERCVFQCRADGIELTEVAPGIDIEIDILGHMDFIPIMNSPVKMDSRIFDPLPMNLPEVLKGSCK
jgi:propionate CoA-transferase